MACHHLRGRGMAVVFGPGRETSLKNYSSVFVWPSLLVLASIFCCPPVAAETAERTTLADTLVVVAPIQKSEVLPNTASLVTRIEIEDTSGFRDVNQLLGSVAGLQVARLGGWGATAVPSLRGSAAAQIQFFVDGVPLPNAQTGQASFGQIPLARLAAIEVDRKSVV